MQARASPQPDTIIALIFGASRWPDCPKFPEAPSLERSADAFIQYLRSEEGLCLPLRNIKSLFGSFDDPSEQLNQAQTFVDQRRREGIDQGRPISDLLLFYAGHGDFERDGRDFYLTIRRTHKDRPLLTSITAGSLGNWVRQTARDLRTFLIIDCCFAAALRHGFLTSPLGLAELRLSEALPDPAVFDTDNDLPVSGVALLAAAGLNHAAIASPMEVYTRFTAALLEVLREGDARLPTFLSLSDLHLLVQRRMSQSFPDGAQPELRSLQQTRGRVELVRLFRNPAAERLKKRKEAELAATKEEEEKGKTEQRAREHRKAELAAREEHERSEAEAAQLALAQPAEEEQQKANREAFQEAESGERLVAAPHQAAPVRPPRPSDFPPNDMAQGTSRVPAIRRRKRPGIWWIAAAALLVGGLSYVEISGKVQILYMSTPPVVSSGQHFDLGNTLYARGKTEEAIAEFRTSLTLNPKNAMAYNNLGLALMKQEKTSEAIAEFRTAITLDPQNASAHNNLGKALLEGSDSYAARRIKVDEATAEFRTAIKIDPKNAEAHHNLGETLLREWDFDPKAKFAEGVAEFHTAFTLDPKNAEAHIDLGDFYFLGAWGEPDDDINEYRTAIKIDPKNARAHHRLGQALAMRKESDEAIAEYRTAIKFDPRNAEIYVDLGEALEVQGKHDDAIAAYHTAIKINPKSDDVYWKLGELLQDRAKRTIPESTRNSMLTEACQLFISGAHLRPDSEAFTNKAAQCSPR
jgi:tetratricopeptide (TPR) repeat protein